MSSIINHSAPVAVDSPFAELRHLTDREVDLVAGGGLTFVRTHTRSISAGPVSLYVGSGVAFAIGPGAQTGIEVSAIAAEGQPII